MHVFDVHVPVYAQQTVAERLRDIRFAGYRAACVMLHADGATLAQSLPSLLQTVRQYALYGGVEAFVGVGLSHIPPPLIGDAVCEARALGAAVVSVCGESPYCDVEVGSMLAAIEAGADIIYYPGLIRSEEVAFAAEKGVALELSTARQQSFANAHVAHLAVEHGCGLLFGSHAHNVAEMASERLLQCTLQGARLSEAGYKLFHKTSAQCLARLLRG